MISTGLVYVVTMFYYYALFFLLLIYCNTVFINLFFISLKLHELVSMNDYCQLTKSILKPYFTKNMKINILQQSFSEKEEKRCEER